MASIERWTTAAGTTEGRLFRSVNRGDRITGESMSDQAIYGVLVQYAGQLGFKCLTPHDARGTWAKLCKKGGSDLQQIELSMGHASIQKTERYERLARTPSII
jgi:integrase